MKLCISCPCFAAAVSARGILYTVCHNTGLSSKRGVITMFFAKSTDCCKRGVLSEIICCP
ncbi:hypothetical protein PF010_g2580 [Phytophthora fragariae]|uniref:Uncharacterized protein n=1 Tax=Phytophthora fragariae TaxID=53985 RepID=A0A6G0LWN0_9STRA|nr:hypothetical protein PF010_g2580 [Phytophthora fragariae]KAE9225195.1 hypothetical protein PF004_g11983 [Phytophthora fragariae]